MMRENFTCLQELFLQSAQLILLRFWGIFVGELFCASFSKKNNKKLDFSWSQLQSCKKNTQKCEHLRFFSPSKVSKLRNFCHSFTGSCVCWRPLWDSSILRKDSTSRFNSPSSSSFSMTTCHRNFGLRFPSASLWQQSSFSHLQSCSPCICLSHDML